MPDLLPWRERSPLIHVSECIHSLAVRYGHYEPSTLNPAQLQLGCAIEHAIIQRYLLDSPDDYFQPGEMELDGIVGTSDLVYIPRRRPHEFKLTWKTVRGFDDEILLGPKYWSNRTQLQCYCRQLESCEGVLEIVFVNGDYSRGDDGKRVAYRRRDFRWSRREINETWALIRNEAERLRRLKEGKR